MKLLIFSAILLLKISQTQKIESGEFATPYAWNSGHYMTTGTGAREVNQYVSFTQNFT